MKFSKLDWFNTSNIILCGQGVAAGFIIAIFRTPFHELGHFVGGWLVGARDMELDYNSVFSKEVDQFPPNRRVIFSLGGPVAERIFILSGLYLLHKSNSFVKLMGLCMSSFSLAAPVTTIFWLLGKQEKFYKGTTYLETNDELHIAQHLGISNPIFVWLVESSLDILIVYNTLRHIPGCKLLTSIGCFFGVGFGGGFYENVLGPALLPRKAAE